MTRTPRSLVVALAVATLTLVGCSVDEEPDASEETAAQESAEESDDSADDGDDEAASSDCATDAVASFPNAGEIELQGGSAVKLADSAYTLYAGDFEVEASTLTGASAEDGQNLATVSITTFNATDLPPALEPGQTIEWTGDFEVLTFAVILNEGATLHGESTGAAGTLEVIEVSDESICVDVDYSDDEKSVVGTIAADVVS